MSNSVQDAVEGLNSLYKHGWYSGGPVFVYDSEGNDISSSVLKVLGKNAQSTKKTVENAEKTSEGSGIDRIFGGLIRLFLRK